MASMRVHELAKEFGMDSKELLSRIQDLKIPAKSHASVLSEDNVEAIKKAIAPELGEKAENIDAEVAKIAKAEKEAAAKKKADEERERREQHDSKHRARNDEPDGLFPVFHRFFCFVYLGHGMPPKRKCAGDGDKNERRAERRSKKPRGVCACRCKKV